MRLFLILFIALLAVPPVYAIAAAQNVNIFSSLGVGFPGLINNQIFQYDEPYATTCQFGSSVLVTVPKNTTNFILDTAALFPGNQTPVVVGVADATRPGLQLDLGLSSSGPRIHLAPQGFICNRVASGFPVFYIDNTSLLDDALVQVFLLSN